MKTNLSNKRNIFKILASGYKGVYIFKWSFTFLFIAIVILECQSSLCQTIKCTGYDIEISGDTSNFNLQWDIKKVEPNLEILTIALSSPNPSIPPEFSLQWSLPSHNIAGFWSVTSGYRKTVHASWAPSRVASMLASSAPVFALFGHDNQNRLSVAVSDALNTVRMSCGLREEDGRIYNRIDFFTEKHGKLKLYEVEVRFDKRNVPYYRALQEIPAWWASFPDYKPAFVPEIAKMPMYSTWYSYHQNVSANALLKEAEIAHKLGFKAIIVDDGWQTLDSSRGYAYTGDWQPERMPHMQEFVDALHNQKMKILLWYAVPFMGEKAKNFERFKGKYLRYWNGQGAYVLDPRYPEVREYIINIYKRAMQEWDLDGFKLDFIARFTADQETVLELADKWDFASVNEAADKLMTDIMSELRKIKPDIMIEFRQPYVGPLMRKYGNMFRVGDCPNVAVSNRVGVVDLRLMSGNTAVHSDMIMWHYGETVEIAALQLLNILFAVPQVSVRLEDIPNEHYEMIKFLIGYWNENRSILLNGTFEALYPLANYPIIAGFNGEKKIVAVYSDQVIPLDSSQSWHQLDIVNAKATERIVVYVHQNLGKFNYAIRDCQGNLTEKNVKTLNKGIHSLTIPASGIISLQKRRDER